MRNGAKKEDNLGLGLVLGIAALLAMGYGMGSPSVAPMLPAKLEKPFANLHRDFDEAGAKAYRSVTAMFGG